MVLLSNALTHRNQDELDILTIDGEPVLGIGQDELDVSTDSDPGYHPDIEDLSGTETDYEQQMISMSDQGPSIYAGLGYDDGVESNCTPGWYCPITIKQRKIIKSRSPQIQIIKGRRPQIEA